MAEDKPKSSDDCGGRDCPSAEQRQIGAAVQSLEGQLKSAHENPTQYEREAHTWAIRTGKGVIIYTILTAIIMIAAVGGTYVAYTTQKLQNRAFVFKRQIDLISTLDETGKVVEWRVAPLWENSGPTPTKSLKMKMDCPSGNFDLSTGDVIKCPKLDFRKETGFYSRFLGPHQTSHEEGSCDAWTPAQVAAIPNHRFFMWAYARYTDILDDEHKTRFCQGVILSGNPTLPHGLAANSIIVEGGNCTDEVCDAQDRQADNQNK